jgi:hypothetical protein
VNDFDFDALRDPDDRGPDGSHRAAVDARARHLRGRARRARLLSSAAVIVAIAAIAGGIVAATRSTGPTITIEGSPTTTAPPIVSPYTTGRFVPPQHGDHGAVVMPVTLPDGERFTVRYPPAMEIAQLGFAGTTGVNGKLVTITYQQVAGVYAGPPVATFPGADGGTVSLFHAKQRSGVVGLPGDELAYQFGPWLAMVEAPTSAADQAQWATNLSGTVDADGYLVLHAQPPLTVANSFEGGFGKVPGNTLELASNLYCGQPGSDTSTRRRQTNGDGSEFVSWCQGTLHVTAEGSPKFLDQAEHDVQIDLPATPNTTTTTPTTAPSAPSSGAVSASFVSRDHGWALDRSGFVWVTTDGGSSWKELSQVAVHADIGKRIRFADSQRGFEFDVGPPYPKIRSLLETVDGGRHWNSVPVPFSNIYDLAIGRGVVYVVALQEDRDAAFRIWSTPVDHLDWKRDPLSIPIGAGPIPSAQLVLSGNEGWLLVDNRTVIAGARLGTGGRWATWTPPCANAGGPATLSASSAADLFAVCDEGVFTGPAVTPAVYVSHNGGRTFIRHGAPLYGSIASPYPNRAVIVSGNEIQRTTDDGASWRAAALPPAHADGAPTDLGFTTTTQGFAVFDNGSMLMTRDAGATWSPVTLP